MKLVVGLGNPGKRYEKTRHNVGFMAVGQLLKDLASFEDSDWRENDKVKAKVAKVGETILVKPQTMMNASGFAVSKLANFYKIEPTDLWVIHDDLDLPLGKIKIRKSGGTAGHHGLESITRQLGTEDFIRFRLGIGKPQGYDEWEKINVKRKKIEDYVLSKFSPQEKSEARRMIKKTSEVAQFALKDGLEKTMNQFHQ